MELGACKQCGQTTYIQNKTRCLCADCVYKNNHGGKSREQVAMEKQQQKKPKVWKLKPTKATGEKEMFLKIWEQRPHVCVNCGKFLGHEPKNYMFSHRIAKGVDNFQRLNPDNIDLLCFDCHFARDMQGQKVFENRAKGLQK